MYLVKGRQISKQWLFVVSDKCTVHDMNSNHNIMEMKTHNCLLSVSLLTTGWLKNRGYNVILPNLGVLAIVAIILFLRGVCA